MYYFNLQNGHEAAIAFAHKGGKKGTKDEPGHPAKCTICKIFDMDDNKKLLACGHSRPIGETADLIPEDLPSQYVEVFYGRRFKKIMKLEDGTRVAIIKGDQFCRATGREESLAKALQQLPREERQAAWDSLFANYKGYGIMEEASEIDDSTGVEGVPYEATDDDAEEAAEAIIAEAERKDDTKDVIVSLPHPAGFVADDAAVIIGDEDRPFVG
jgi:hypothetical protein